jgi:hypothetical protein
MKGGDVMITLMDELRCSLNKYSRENYSNTPDFILAEYLIKCLDIFEEATNKRDNWYGYKPMKINTTL